MMKKILFAIAMLSTGYGAEAYAELKLSCAPASTKLLPSFTLSILSTGEIKFNSLAYGEKIFQNPRLTYVDPNLGYCKDYHISGSLYLSIPDALVHGNTSTARLSIVSEDRVSYDYSCINNTHAF